MLDLSAILSIIFCSFVMMNKCERQISEQSHVVVRYGLKMMANTSEIIIFIMLGLTSVQEFMTDFWRHWLRFSDKNIWRTFLKIKKLKWRQDFMKYLKSEYRSFLRDPHSLYSLPVYVGIWFNFHPQSVPVWAYSLQWPVYYVYQWPSRGHRLFPHKIGTSPFTPPYSPDAINLHCHYFIHIVCSRFLVLKFILTL